MLSLRRLTARPARWRLTSGDHAGHRRANMKIPRCTIAPYFSPTATTLVRSCLELRMRLKWWLSEIALAPLLLLLACRTSWHISLLDSASVRCAGNGQRRAEGGKSFGTQPGITGHMAQALPTCKGVAQYRAIWPVRAPTLPMGRRDAARRRTCKCPSAIARRSFGTRYISSSAWRTSIRALELNNDNGLRESGLCDGLMLCRSRKLFARPLWKRVSVMRCLS